MSSLFDTSIQKLSEKFLVEIHEEAKKVTADIRSQEVNLILVLQRVDEYKVFRAYKYPSFFKYLTCSLGFSEHRAYTLITVVRATRRFKKLGQALRESKITVSKAKRVATVLTEENVEEWIRKSQINSHRSLERLVAGENPETLNLESAHYVSASQVEVRIVLSEKEYNHLKRAQALLSAKEKKAVVLRATLIRGVSDFIERNDPVFRALRAKRKEERKKNSIVVQERADDEPKMESENNPELVTCTKKGGQMRRIPIPAAIFHEVYMRDHGKCQATTPTGEKCHESRWVHLHHKILVKDGGENTLENLTTLCSGHHGLEHWRESGTEL